MGIGLCDLLEQEGCRSPADLQGRLPHGGQGDR
jgi:hypothetical protein